MILLIVAVLAVIQGFSCHVYRLGACPTVDPFPEFDVSKFLGRWFVIQKFSTASSCWTYDFLKNDTDNSFRIEQSREQFLLDTLGYDHTYKYIGTLDLPDPERPGALRVRFPMSVAGKADYIIFSTDYENYAGIYSCQPLLFGHRRTASILSRKPTLDQVFINKVRSKLDSFSVDPHDFSIISQKNCAHSNRTISVDPDTFSAPSIGNAVKTVGDAIGNGVKVVADSVGGFVERFGNRSSNIASERNPDFDAEWF